MFGLNLVRNENLQDRPVPLLESDEASSYASKSQSYDDQLKGLVSSDGCLESSNSNNDVQGPEFHEKNLGFTDFNGKIDAMVHGNLLEFANMANANPLSKDPRVIT